jgi:hypothetical protein
VFRARVEAALADDRWVCDGNYPAVHPVVLARATDVVWIDPPKAIVMAQVVWRSVVRGATRAELWNGNRESVASWLDPEHPIQWAWSTFEKKRVDYEALMTRPEYAHLRFHRLRSRQATRAFIEGMHPQSAPQTGYASSTSKPSASARSTRP